MNKNNPDSWVATQEMYKRIDLLLSGVLEKYDVGIKTDVDFSKGSIKIIIKDKKPKK